MKALTSLWTKFRGLRTWQQLIIAIFIVGLVGQASAGGGGAVSSAPTAEASGKAGPTSNPMPEVVWSDYAPSVKTRIDAAAKSADCAALQTEFDQADANNEATRNRTGHSNTELMSYIDESMKRAGCYSG